MQQFEFRDYKNPANECNRHMWLHANYKCPNCGTIWLENSITNSFRQTFTSECFRGNGECFKREAYHRQNAGESFITKSMVIGVPGANNLTPKPVHVRRADKEGYLVGINPKLKRFQLFKRDVQHPQKKIKVPDFPQALFDAIVRPTDFTD